MAIHHNGPCAWGVNTSFESCIRYGTDDNRRSVQVPLRKALLTKVQPDADHGATRIDEYCDRLRAQTRNGGGAERVNRNLVGLPVDFAHRSRPGQSARLALSIERLVESGKAEVTRLRSAAPLHEAITEETIA